MPAGKLTTGLRTSNSQRQTKITPRTIIKRLILRTNLHLNNRQSKRFQTCRPQHCKQLFKYSVLWTTALYNIADRTAALVIVFPAISALATD